MKIGFKITLLGIIAVISIAIISFISITSIRELNGMFDVLGEKYIKNTAYANKIIYNLSIMVHQSALMCLEEKNKDKHLAINAAALENINSTLDSLKANVAKPETKAIIEKFDDAFAAQMQLRKEFLTAINNHDIQLATKIRMTTLQASIENTISIAEELIAFYADLLNEYCFVTSNDVAYSLLENIIILIIIVLIILVAVVYVITKSITKPLQKAVEAANHVAEGNMVVDLSTNSKDETGVLMNALELMVKSIDKLITDTNTLSTAAIEGRLEIRANINNHEGAFKELIDGINKTLDAIIGPLNVTAEYVDRISKGELPPRIVDAYNGDFNEIKNNLNRCIDVIEALIKEIITSINEATNGNLQHRADANKFQGDYNKIIKGVNNLVDLYYQVLHVRLSRLQ
jgi:methyl-accepting chemotaxis protein